MFPPKEPSLKNMAFCQLVVNHRGLADARREHAGLPAEERRLAAQWAYDAGCAASVIGDKLLPFDSERGPCDGAMWALAIDPEYGPARLTVGTVEHQLGRRAEAMSLFSAMARSRHEMDLSELVEEAVNFLLDEKDLRAVLELYEAATQAHPRVALFWNGLGYAHGKLGQKKQAVEFSRRAAEMEPRNHVFLNDLGWALAEAGDLAEGEKVLERAVKLSPRSDKVAKINLADIRRRRSR